MSDLVTIETYTDPIEAQLAKNDLIDSGIKAFLVGEDANALWHVSTEMGMIKLQVAAEDAAQAVEILKSPARSLSSDEELAAEAEAAGEGSEEDDEENEKD